MTISDLIAFHELEAAIQLNAHRHHLKEARKAYLDSKLHRAIARDYKRTAAEITMSMDAKAEAEEALWIEVDDFGALERKCNFFCDLHVVRPGKTQCNCPNN